MRRAYDITRMVDMLIRHEGIELKPYEDTMGYTTIGIGRNLTTRGISDHEAFVLARNDIMGAEDDLDRNVPWWRSLDPVRQMVLVNMAFNMGWPVLSRFRNFWACLKVRDFETATDEMLTSRWADQVKGRADELAEMMRTGQDRNVA